MPIYEYRRPDGTTFELQQSFSEESLKVDPDTGVPVERVLHPPAVHFKGKGFYNTDYGTRNRQRETAAAAEKSSSSAKSGSDSASKSGSDSAAKSGSDGASASSSSAGSQPSSSDGGKAPAKAKESKPVPAKS
jgi:predicted nucleic acid-binding Zn ribbon protein